MLHKILKTGAFGTQMRLEFVQKKSPQNSYSVAFMSSTPKPHLAFLMGFWEASLFARENRATAVQTTQALRTAQLPIHLPSIWKKISLKMQDFSS